MKVSQCVRAVVCVCRVVVVVGGSNGHSDKDMGSQGLNSLTVWITQPLSPSRTSNRFKVESPTLAFLSRSLSSSLLNTYFDRLMIDGADLDPFLVGGDKQR